MNVHPLIRGGKYLLSLFLFVSLLLTPSSVAAEAAIPQTDQTPLIPLPATAAPIQPRYISGFGLDNSYTIFYEDRHDTVGCTTNLFRIYFMTTTNGPGGFSIPVQTDICDSHFTVKNWPITVGSTPYSYRAWGAGTSSGSHNFYVSNNLVNWTLVTTFTFNHPSDEILYGFHDIIQLNGHYLGFVESAGGSTYIVRSDTGDWQWTIVARVGGASPGVGPLDLSFTGDGPIPSGNFMLMEVGGQIVYGKLMIPGNRQGAYLAINLVAAQAATPALEEAAFENPTNWKWADGSVGLPGTGSRVLASSFGSGGHTVQEAWTVPRSKPHADHIILYIGKYANGNRLGIGFAVKTAAGMVATPTVNTITPANGTTVQPTNALSVTFSEEMKHDGSSGAANNPANYLLVEANGDGFQTTSCAAGVGGNDLNISIDSAVYELQDGIGTPFEVTLGINGGNLLSLGSYRLFICGTTSVQDMAGNKINGGLSDTVISFTVLNTVLNNVVAVLPQTGFTVLNTVLNNVVAVLPQTGFAPGVITRLPTQAQDRLYNDLGSIWLEIPSLKIKATILGVPVSKDGWDLTWLGSNVGWLQGTAFPTWAGNSALTAHVYDADGQPGLFVNLHQLGWGDQVIVHAWGQSYVYEVRSIKNDVRPNDISAIKHEDLPWLTLITCKGYDSGKDSYRYRLVVRAVQVRFK